jgi:hypothetical protein
MMLRLKLSVHFRTLKALVKYCESLGDFKISFGFARKKIVLPEHLEADLWERYKISRKTLNSFKKLYKLERVEN